jgi:hypothetical protein
LNLKGKFTASKCVTRICPLPIAHCLLPIAHCSLPIAYCSLLIAYCLLPNAHCPLPMTDDLQLYQTILFTQRPWMDTSTTEAKYRELLHSTRPEDFAHQPLYELSFLKPLTPKTKYFQIIIHNEAVSFLNRMHHVIDHAINDNEKKYHIHVALGKKLPALFNETQRIIRSHQFNFSLLNDVSVDKKVIENVFIVQFLKYRLIQLYLEIQDSFHEYYSEQDLSVEELHSLYFNDPFQDIIKPIPTTGPKRKIESANANKKELEPIKDDFRRTRQNILCYEDIISNPEQFASVEVLLHKMELIDDEYNFKENHTDKQKLAAVYHLLIKNGFFKKKNLHRPRGIRDIDIRRFLNYRYNCNVNEQFNIWKRSPEKLTTYIEGSYWLEKLSQSKR